MERGLRNPAVRSAAFVMRVGIIGAGMTAAVHARAWQAAGATVSGVWSHSVTGLAQLGVVSAADTSG